MPKRARAPPKSCKIHGPGDPQITGGNFLFSLNLRRRDSIIGEDFRREEIPLKYEIRCNQPSCGARYALVAETRVSAPLFCAFCGRADITVRQEEPGEPAGKPADGESSLRDLLAMNPTRLADYIVETQDLDVQCDFAGGMPPHYFRMLSESERLVQVSDGIGRMPKETLEMKLRRLERL